MNGLVLEHPITRRPTSSGRCASRTPAHAKLLIDRQRTIRRSDGQIDAIMVPAGRRAKHLRTVARLSAQYGCLLIVLASRDCEVSEAAAVIASIAGAKAEILDVRIDPLAHYDLHTSHEGVLALSPGRSSDLSLKRNIGLIYGRLRGFRSVLFMDDDIIRVTTSDLGRLAHELDHRRMAGMLVTSFPDNSVLMHANRLVDLRQGVFATGAVLATRCDDLPMGFFPNVYNEDWLFFAGEAMTHGIVSVGAAVQKPYQPFDQARATGEEFGDLLGEGLFSLFDEGKTLVHATLDYWELAIDRRHEQLDHVLTGLLGLEWTNELNLATASLLASRKQLDTISPADCSDYIQAWRRDIEVFDTYTQGLPTGRTARAAASHIELPLRLAEFGESDVQGRELTARR